MSVSNLLVVVLLIHYQAASGLEILLQQRTPGCNPVVENTDVTLKVVTDSPWDACVWYRSPTAEASLTDENVIVVCKQALAEHKCTNNTLIRSTEVSGGDSAENKQSCSLHIMSIESSLDNGFWNVEVSYTAQNGTGSKDMASFEILSNRRNDLTLTTNSTNNFTTSTGVRTSYWCEATDGLPQPTSFEWRINDTLAFYEDWQPIFYPIQMTTEPAMTRQQISLVPPNVGNFVIQCISHQNEFYSTTAVVNLNVNSSDGSDGDGSTVLSTAWIIVIAVSCGLVVILIAIVLIAYCCRICCFKNRKETDVPTTNTSSSQQQAAAATKTQQNQSTFSQPKPILDQQQQRRPDVIMPRRDEYYNATRSGAIPMRSTMYDTQVQQRPQAQQPNYYSNNGFRNDYNSQRYQSQPISRQGSNASSLQGALV